MTFNTGSVTGLGYLLECRHRIRGDLLRWEGLGAQSVPQVTPFRFIFHWKTVALYIKKISCPFPSEPLFFHVWVVEEYEEPMQYHLKSSCSSSEVKVQIQACTQWSGENAFQHRWKFTINIIFYVPNASLAQNSSGSGQRRTCKYYVKNAEKGHF